MTSTYIQTGRTTAKTKGFENKKSTMLTAFETIGNAIKDVFSKPINATIGVVENVVNGLISGINFFIREINKIGFDIPDWVPLIGGNRFGFNIPELKSIQMQKFATGGVVDRPTVGLMGEYPNVQANPEIIAPQSLIYDTVVAANGELVDAFSQFVRIIVKAIEDNKTEVNIGDDEIARSARRGNERMAKITNVR